MATGAGDDLDLRAIATEQHRLLMEAKTLESDLDLAFDLQLQEAITASLSLHPCTSSAPSSPPPTELSIPSSSNDAVLSVSGLQAVEVEKFQQEFNDRMLSDAEFRKMRDDFSRRIHDQKLAREIQEMPDDDWEEYGDNFERPHGEGCSKLVNSEMFRVYFKGLVSEERVRDSKVKLAGIGVAICDSSDQLIFELKKPLEGPGLSRVFSEAKALIEGLNAAIALDLRKLVFYCDYYPIYQFVTGRWPPRQRKIATLMNQVSVLQKKFTCCDPSIVPRNDIKFAFKLARDAIVSQINRPAESSGSRNMYETCVICLEDTDVSQMFSLDGCFHRYCFSCMKQHVEVKLLHGMLPKCPHDGCNTELEIDSCGKFLTPKLIELMKQRIQEASIPVTEKVYCPYPKCSALMSKTEVHEYTKGTLVPAERSGLLKCIKCQGNFCVNCKVPWHYYITCFEYKKRNPKSLAEDTKLKTLAARNLWRQCVKCNHMIELATGCYHMTCRCGYEFCYTCGAEWKNKKATCSCPLWDDDNIIYSDEDDFDEEDDDDFYDSDSDYYD